MQNKAKSYKNAASQIASCYFDYKLPAFFLYRSYYSFKLKTHFVNKSKKYNSSQSGFCLEGK